MLCLYSCQLLKAQSPAYRQFTDDDGLPSMTVYGIKQDKDGFLWIATTKGICRFDGKEFKKYFIPDMKGQDFPYIFMDETGTPWFYNLAGEVFYVQDDTVRRFNIMNRFEGSRIASFFSFKNQVYVTWDFNNVLCSYIYDLDEPLSFIKLDYNYLFLGLIDDNVIGAVIENSEDSIRLLNVNTNKIVFNKKLTPNSIQKFSSDFSSIRVLNDGNLLVLTSYFSGILDRYFNIIKELYFENNINDKIIYISCINDYEVFVKTYSRTYKINLLSNLSFLINDFGNSLNSVFEDNLKRSWYTTTNDGIYYSFGTQCTILNSKNSQLASNEVLTINGAGDNIFFGHSSGILSCYNINVKKWKIFNLGNSNRIRSIISNALGYFVATDNEVFLIDKSLDLSRKLDNVKMTGIKGIQIDKKDRIFMLTRLGTSIFNLSKFKSRKIQHSFHNLIIDKRSNCAEPFNGGMLIGTTRGVYFCKDTCVFDFGEKIIGNYYINDISVFNDSICFISTDNNGVYIFKDSLIVDSINIFNGMPSNSVSSFIQMNNHVSIIGTDKGCFVYNYFNKQGFTLNTLDGLPGNEILDLYLKDSLIYIATQKGIASIGSNQLNPNLEAPFLKLNRIDVFSNNGIKHNLDILKYNENHIKIYLLIRSLLSNGKVDVFYKLHDSDISWYKSTLPYIELIGLDPGEYQIGIKVRNEDGIFSNNTLRICFQINEPWWKVIWFNSMFIVTFLFCITLVSVIRFISIRKSERYLNEIFEQMNDLKLQTLQIQMNPHFVFNSLNAIQGFLSKNDENGAMLFMSKFAHLIRIIFEHSKCKYITLEDEVILLKKYIELEEIRVGKIFSVIFEVDEYLVDKMKFIVIPPLLVQPIVENSFRHGLYHSELMGSVKIFFRKVQGYIVCVVEDNGIGRKMSKRINSWKNRNHVSTGISSTVERLNILNKNSSKYGIDIEDSVDANGIINGTRTTIYLSKYKYN